AAPAPRQSDGRVAIVVALNAPLDAECPRRRRLDIDRARLRDRASRLCEQHVRHARREQTEHRDSERPHLTGENSASCVIELRVMMKLRIACVAGVILTLIAPCRAVAQAS